MDFLHFGHVSFRPGTNIGKLCEDLNNTVGKAIWYDTFAIRNTKWLWFVNDIVAIKNTDNILCGCFGLYPSFVAGILDSVKDINFYVLCNKKIITQTISRSVFLVERVLFSIQETISCYHMVEKQFIYHLKQESYMKSVRLN
jgi:hypothetical protein